jgi:hypothetical protein
MLSQVKDEGKKNKKHYQRVCEKLYVPDFVVVIAFPSGTNMLEGTSIPSKEMLFKFWAVATNWTTARKRKHLFD